MNNAHAETFVYYLDLLTRLIAKVEQELDGEAEILQARLAPDMFPLGVQVEIAASFALRACCPIAGKPVVSFSHGHASFADLKRQLIETIEHIEMLDSLENDLDTVVHAEAGPTPVSLPASEFLSRFAYPNFFFHLSMVYAIARSRGVPLTKGDFDGFHEYPPGFSFESGDR